MPECLKLWIYVCANNSLSGAKGILPQIAIDCESYSSGLQMSETEQMSTKLTLLECLLSFLQNLFVSTDIGPYVRVFIRGIKEGKNELIYEHRLWL